MADSAAASGSASNPLSGGSQDGDRGCEGTGSRL